MYLPEATGNFLSSDEDFDKLFPIYIQKLSGIHWTPLNVAAVVSRFLAPNANARVIEQQPRTAARCANRPIVGRNPLSDNPQAARH